MSATCECLDGRWISIITKNTVPSFWGILFYHNINNIKKQQQQHLSWDSVNLFVIHRERNWKKKKREKKIKLKKKRRVMRNEVRLEEDEEQLMTTNGSSISEHQKISTSSRFSSLLASKDRDYLLNQHGTQVLFLLSCFFSG